MRLWWWRLRLTVLMTVMDYTPRARWKIRVTWFWTDEPEWKLCYDSGRGPLRAIREDRSIW